jgi:hypothetical protein
MLEDRHKSETRLFQYVNKGYKFAYRAAESEFRPSWKIILVSWASKGTPAKNL